MWDKCSDCEYGDIDELRLENQELKERIAYLERSNNRREDTILEQRQEIGDLEDNWNTLWQYILEKDNRGYEKVYTDDILDKMQEIEKVKSDE